VPRIILDGRVFQQDVSPLSESRSRQYGVTTSHGIFSVLIARCILYIPLAFDPDGQEVSLVWTSSRGTPAIHFLASIFKRSHHQARNLSKELCRDSSMQGVRKGKDDIVFDESRFLPFRSVHDRLKSPGCFEGLEQRCGGGCDSLTRADGVSPGGWGAPRGLRLTFTESYGEQMTLLT